MSEHWDTGITATEMIDNELQAPAGFDTSFQPKEPEMNAHAPVHAEGVKLDAGKARIDLIAPEMLFAIGEILAFGADKYGVRNWEKGMAWGRLFAAMMRHLWAWWGGKTPTKENFVFGELDMETGKSHLWHAACCLMMLIAFESRGHGTDDRFG